MSCTRCVLHAPCPQHVQPRALGSPSSTPVSVSQAAPSLSAHQKPIEPWSPLLLPATFLKGTCCRIRSPAASRWACFLCPRCRHSGPGCLRVQVVTAGPPAGLAGATLAPSVALVCVCDSQVTFLEIQIEIFHSPAPNLQWLILHPGKDLNYFPDLQDHSQPYQITSGAFKIHAGAQVRRGHRLRESR